MAVSQNGYSANDRSAITSYVVSDGGRTMNLRKGSPGELLTHFVRWFDSNIRDIDPGIMDDWSYAERPIRGGVELSNHASGTAADVDATKWPLGVQPEAYLTGEEIARVRAQLKIYEGCIRWGGDYTGRKDPMHFEIDRNQAACDRVWAKLQSNPQSEEFTVSQYDEIIARFEQLRNESWTQHTDAQNVRAAYHREEMGALVGNNTGGKNNFHWTVETLTAVILGAIKSIPGVQVEVVEAAIAKAVADEIDRRDRERLDHAPVT